MWLMAGAVMAMMMMAREVAISFILHIAPSMTRSSCISFLIASSFECLLALLHMDA
jgi:hypothetical protein